MLPAPLPSFTASPSCLLHRENFLFPREETQKKIRRKKNCQSNMSPRGAGRMERPSSAPRPRIRRAPGSLESSFRGVHFAVNMCCLRIRDPAFARGNHLSATSLSVSSAIATPLLTARSRMHVGPPPTRRHPHRTRYFAVDALAHRSMAGPQTFSR